MYKALVIDDEPLAVSLVREYLQAYPQIEVVQECHNGFEGVKAIQQHQPDLIFLDVQMPKITGFEMLELLDEMPSVIFTTAFDEYAIKAFEAHAVDYLLKPFSKERFSKAVDKWLEQQKQQTRPVAVRELVEEGAALETLQRVVVKTGANIRIIPVEEIVYLEADDDYVKINTAKESFLKKQTMGHFEKALPADTFVRVHRSFMVQLNQITRLEPLGKDTFSALLRNGTRIPLSKTGYPKLKQALGL
jgi:two-component system LytT family response regulator